MLLARAHAIKPGLGVLHRKSEGMSSGRDLLLSAPLKSRPRSPHTGLGVLWKSFSNWNDLASELGSPNEHLEDF